jgi:dephospho-CoA kinase
VIGLIGAIGAGKSLAAQALARRGGFVLDADAVGHALLRQRPIRDRIVAHFGTSILTPAESPEDAPVIDRRALAAIVFADPRARRDLEAIVHPWMRRTFTKAIARTVRRQQAQAVILDAAILLEAGWDDLCDVVVFVDAPRSQRIARLASQRGWSEETLQARERAQWPPEEKRRQAAFVLCNDAEPSQLDEEVARFWEALRPPRRRPRGGTPSGRTCPR